VGELLEAFPPHERGKAMGFWGLGIVVAASVPAWARRRSPPCHNDHSPALVAGTSGG